MQVNTIYMDPIGTIGYRILKRVSKEGDPSRSYIIASLLCGKRNLKFFPFIYLKNPTIKAIVN